jgi:hypothetical protein
MGERYLQKMRFLNRTPGLRQERMGDLLRRSKAKQTARQYDATD